MNNGLVTDLGTEAVTAAKPAAAETAGTVLAGGAAAVGLAEFSSIAAGIAGMDAAVKNNDVNLLIASAVCPGKFLLVVNGKHAAVTACIDTLNARFTEHLIASRVIGNLSGGILGEHVPRDHNFRAIGIIETSDASGAIYAADEAVKTAGVTLVRLKLANGIGGKGAAVVAGGISEVAVAVETAAQGALAGNRLVGKAVITNPDTETVKRIWEL